MRKVLLLVLFFTLGCSVNKDVIVSKNVIIVDKKIGLIHYSTDLLFSSNQIKPKHISKVKWIASVMVKNPNKRYSLEAHTNTVELEKDSVIGKKRLDVLKRMLIDRGVNVKQLNLIDHMDKYPIDIQTTEKGRNNNRRIEVKELKIKIK